MIALALEAPKARIGGAVTGPYLTLSQGARCARYLSSKYIKFIH